MGRCNRCLRRLLQATEQCNRVQSGYECIPHEREVCVCEGQFLSEISNNASCYDKHLLSVLGKLGLLHRVGQTKSAIKPEVTPERKHRKHAAGRKSRASTEELMKG